jgi:polar amino acid transport system substrate-binding protein
MMAAMKFLPMLSLLVLSATSHSGELVFAVSSGSAMPMTRFEHQELTGGMLKGLGDALAGELRMTPRYLVVPRKRVAEPLFNGSADILCDLHPEWLPDERLLWTQSIFTNHQIIAARTGTAPVAKVTALAGKPVGTILGYRYPEIETALGKDFVRDEATSDDVNLAKLLRGRFEYIVTNSFYYDYQRKVHPEGKALSGRSFRTVTFDTYCAIPKGGKLKLARVDSAIAALHRRGTLQKIIQAYRPD